MPVTKPQPQATGCTGWTIETLKELLEKRFDQLDKLREAEAKSLVLQAKEYERRLNDLNGEAARIAAVHEKNATNDDLDRVERENAELHRKQDALLMTRPEHKAQHDSLASEFHAAVTLFQSEIAGLKEWKAELVSQLVQLREIGPLKDWRNEQRGKASINAVIGAYVIAIAGWLISPQIGRAHV